MSSSSQLDAILSHKTTAKGENQTKQVKCAAGDAAQELGSDLCGSGISQFGHLNSGGARSITFVDTSNISACLYQ